MCGDDQANSSVAPAETLSIRGLFARDGVAILAAAAVTLVVELGVFFLAGGLGQPEAALAVLAAVLVWVAMSAPVFAAGGADGFGAVLRAAAVVDASAVTLLVLWIFARQAETAEPCVTFVAAAKIYCILAVVAMAGVSAVRCARSPAGRYAAAVVFAVVMLAAMSTGFWTGGLLESTHGTARDMVVSWAVYINPFYSVASATVAQTFFVWHEAPWMYGITLIGNTAAPPPVPWYAAGIMWGIIACILAATRLVRRRL